MNNKFTYLYGLTGFPLSHSFSKSFFDKFFKDNKIDASYENFETKNFDKNFILGLLKKHPNLKGLNVTSPYKKEAFRIADFTTVEAKLVNAANCLKFSFDEQNNPIIIAHNTDIEGFQRLTRSFNNKITKALICGTGGAAQAVKVALGFLDVNVLFVSRKPNNEINSITYSDIDKKIIEEYTLIINATPLGMHPMESDCVDIPYDLLSPQNICIDLIYNPSETLFLKKSKKAGASVVNGLEMLFEQAKASYLFWTNPQQMPLEKTQA